MSKNCLLFILIIAALSDQSIWARNDIQDTKEASFLQQIFILKQLKPDLKKIGVLCEVKQHKDLKAKLGRLQKQAQVEFILYNIKKLPDVAKHAKNATTSKKVDALWVFADKILLDSKTESYLVKHSIQTKVFLLAVEPELVKKGGTASIRKGQSKPVIFLNQKAIDLLALTVPPGLSESAEVVMF